MGEENKCSLVDVNLQPVADVVNNIINKFAQAVGWVATPRGSRKDMEIAIENYIKEIQKDNSLPPIVKAAKIGSARKEIKEYINIQDILQYAQGFEEENDSNPLDEDWAMFFYDKAKNISIDDAKILWGKILSEECNKRGSIPKQLIHILSVMSADDAKTFECVCGFVVNKLLNDGVNMRLGKNVLMMGDNWEEMNNLTGIKDSALTNLEALGLIKRSLVNYEYTVTEKNKENLAMVFAYHNHWISIGNLKEKVPVGLVTLTKAGEILSNIVVKKEQDGFLEYIKKFYVSNGFIVRVS